MVSSRFASIAEFPIPDLESNSLNEDIQRLEHARRREELFAIPEKASLCWQSRAAQYFYEIASYGESDAHSNRLVIAALDKKDDRHLAQGYLYQCLTSIAAWNTFKLRLCLQQLKNLASESSDDLLRATYLFARALSHEKCPSWGPNGPFDDPNDWCNVFLSFKEAGQLFLSVGEIDSAILCHIEYAHSKIAHGEYITAIEWIERALTIARDHNAWKWTGRMLLVAGNAATDQGYRHRVEWTIRAAIRWCEFTGDEWGRIDGLTTLSRLLSFEMSPNDVEEARVAEEILVQASRASDQAGLPWLKNRAQRALKFVKLKSGGSPENFSGDQLDARLDFDILKRITTRLQDGIQDSPDPFMIFNALRNEDSICEDFISEYRNSSANRLVDARTHHVLLFSEVSLTPCLQGLGPALLNATEKRESFEDNAEVFEGTKRLWYRRRISPSGDGAVVKLRDVTAEVEIQDALRDAADSARRSERTMSEFVANMSHEIRTPISGVLGLAKMLSETNLDPVQRSYVNDIVGSGDLLLGVIGDILDMSKLEAGFLEIVPEPIVIRDLVNGIAGLYRGQAAAKKVLIRCDISDSVPQAILIDGIRFRQILANLVGNAIKFTNSGSITLQLSSDGSELVTQVIDSGIGIPVERLGTIFDRFGQVDGGRKGPSGTGLGLTISKRLSQLMDGSIEVESEIGKGSRFTVRLPLVEAEIPKPVASSELPTLFEGMRILLVDDNEVNLKVSNHVLKKHGCAVVMATDGQTALDILRDQTFDLVFMDVRMPGLDGLEATQEIRRREAGTGKRIPIVALTAGALTEERDACLAAGMDEYVAKPFSDESVRRILAKWRS